MASNKIDVDGVVFLAQSLASNKALHACLLGGNPGCCPENSQVLAQLLRHEQADRLKLMPLQLLQRLTGWMGLQREEVSNAMSNGIVGSGNNENEENDELFPDDAFLYRELTDRPEERRGRDGHGRRSIDKSIDVTVFQNSRSNIGDGNGLRPGSASSEFSFVAAHSLRARSLGSLTGAGSRTCHVESTPDFQGQSSRGRGAITSKASRNTEGRLIAVSSSLTSHRGHGRAALYSYNNDFDVNGDKKTQGVQRIVNGGGEQSNRQNEVSYRDSSNNGTRSADDRDLDNFEFAIPTPIESSTFEELQRSSPSSPARATNGGGAGGTFYKRETAAGVDADWVAPPVAGEGSNVIQADNNGRPPSRNSLRPRQQQSPPTRPLKTVLVKPPHSDIIVHSEGHGRSGRRASYDDEQGEDEERQLHHSAATLGYNYPILRGSDDVSDVNGTRSIRNSNSHESARERSATTRTTSTKSSGEGRRQEQGPHHRRRSATNRLCNSECKDQAI